jgi:hypothetical protein
VAPKVKVQSFTATELGWLCLNRAENIWEHPDGTVQHFDPAMAEPVITILEIMGDEDDA